MKINKLLYLLFCTFVCALLLGGCATQNDKSLGSAAISIPSYAIKAPSAGKIIGLISEKGERISKGQPLRMQEELRRIARADAAVPEERRHRRIPANLPRKRR